MIEFNKTDTNNLKFFPNQRMIKINTMYVDTNSERNSFILYKDVTFEAMRKLKPSTFKVWLFLASNKNGYNLEYSPAYLEKVIDISPQTAKNAFDELREKKYIISTKNNYIFNFFLVPKDDNSIIKETSIGEQHIAEILNKHNIEYLYDSPYFSDLHGDTDLLRYDFILLEEEKPFRIIEFNGEQHNRPVEKYGGEEGFKKLQQYDKIKDEYALKHNIPLIRIPYHMRDKITLSLIMSDKYLVTSNSEEQENGNE